jgi:subtilisin-like proprotein convertase family protein
MKTYLILLLLVVGLISPHAQPITLTTNWTSGFVNGGVVPDNDPSGWVDSRVVNGTLGEPINLVEVTLNLSGGYTGDIYAYLLHDGVMSVLLNRVGTPANSGNGYLDNGFDVTLSDTAAFSIHNYQADNPIYSNGSITGTWQPDGGGLNVFQGMDGDGTWDLFVADESSGGVMTVASWGLTIQTVPEPSLLALTALGGGLFFFRQRK